VNRLPFVVVSLAVLAACSGTSHHAASPASSPSATEATTAGKTVWLCRPGAASNPCASSLTSTAVLPDGTRHGEATPPPVTNKLDCFYVYPTVSQETTPNADLQIQPAETNVAIAQAARFSSACRVWAPMYRQRTVNDLFNVQHGASTSSQNQLALSSLRAAWRDYLAHDNQGRRVVLIGHSQGAAMLIRLIREDIDPNAALRSKIALAILAGGNVTVRNGPRLGGALSGGSFQHMPLCTHVGESGCVIAYSTFPKQPPAFSLFGRAGAGVSALSGETATNRQVACVNPAALSGNPSAVATLHPYVPSSQLPTVGTSTPWASFPGRYRAQCRHSGTATWLEVTPTKHTAGQATLLQENLGPAWGYHIVDVNLALGDLVNDVAAVAH
jgi:hypothetical protein